MDPMLMIMGMTALIPLCCFGMMKIVDIYRQMILVRQGYVKADFTRTNGRQIVKFTRPSDGVNVIEGKTYPFNDDPSYVVQENGILGTVPKISIDARSCKQVKLRNVDEKDIVPQLMTGAGKLSYVRGQADASMELKEIKNLIIIGVVCSLISALATLAPMLMKPSGAG